MSRGDLHFEGWGGRRGSAVVAFETAMVVSYRLFIVTIAYLPQFSIERL